MRARIQLSFRLKTKIFPETENISDFRKLDRTAYFKRCRNHFKSSLSSTLACDFVFVSEDLAHRIQAMQVDLDTQASDHQPALITFAWKIVFNSQDHFKFIALYYFKFIALKPAIFSGDGHAHHARVGG